MQTRALAPCLLTLALLVLLPIESGCDGKAGDTAGLSGDNVDDTVDTDDTDGSGDTDTTDGGDGTDPTDIDGDDDGYRDSEDCDDTNAGIHPGADELCNGLDDDCDEEIDEDAVDVSTWYTDADGDGHGDPDSSPVQACAAPTGTEVLNADDCNDADAAINPDAVETCNDLDDNCDGNADEEASDGTAWYADADLDGYGDPATATTSCAGASGYIANGADCDDDDDTVHPGATELCDGQFNDCDDPGYEAAGAPDDELDDDGDLHVECALDSSAWVGDAAILGGSDCDDSSASLSPDATEDCDDSVDNDCDYAVDCDDSDCSSECGPTLPSCADDDLGSSTGTSVASGSSVGTGDDLAPSCGGAGGEDMAYAFTAPAEGCYLFSTNASSYDTMVSALSGCSTELDCDDDGGTGATSNLYVGLASGEQIVVVIDAFDSTYSGSYQLDISRTSPTRVTADTNLGTATGDALASGTVPTTNRSLETDCDSVTSPGTDHVYLWTASATGTVTIDSSSSSADTVLAVFDARCYTEVACDDDGGTGTTSEIELDVVAGRSYLIRVSGHAASTSGSVVLDINY